MLQPTTRFYFRPQTIEDQDAVFQLRSDAEINKYIDRPKAITIEDAQNHIRKIQKLVAESEAYFWVIADKEDDLFVGTILIMNVNDQLTIGEIGYELLPQYQGKGVMQEVIPSLLTYAESVLNLENIEACVHEDNIKSIKLLEKFGFSTNGIIFEDHLLMYKLCF